MKSIYILSFLFLLGLGSNHAQSRFDEYFKEGQRLEKRYQYQRAIDNYLAALKVQGISTAQSNSATQAIKKAQEGNISAIRAQQRKAENAEREAVAAQKRAEEEAQRANDLAAKFEQEAKVTRANSWAYLADQEMERKDYASAVALSFGAYEMLESNPIPKIKATFGQAVKSAFQTIVDTGAHHFQDIFFSKDGSAIIGSTEKQELVITVLGEETTSIIPPKNDERIYAFASLTAQQGGSLNSKGEMNMWKLDLDQAVGKGREKITQFSQVEKEALGMKFSPDGQKVMTWYIDGTAKLWNTDQANRRTAIHTSMDQHKSPILSVHFSPDGKHIATRSADNTVAIWDMNGIFQSNLIKHDKHIYSATFSPDGQKILTASADNTAKIWRLSDFSFVEMSINNGLITSAGFVPNKDWVYITDTEGRLSIWNTEGKALNTISAHDGPIEGASYSLDGTHAITYSGRNIIKLWDEGGNVKILDKHTVGSNIIKAQFSPNGTYLLSTASDGTAKVWDMAGELVLEEKGEGDILAEFSPNSKQILISHKKRTIISPLPYEVYQEIKNGTRVRPQLSKEKQDQFGIDISGD